MSTDVDIVHNRLDNIPVDMPCSCVDNDDTVVTLSFDQKLSDGDLPLSDLIQRLSVEYCDDPLHGAIDIYDDIIGVAVDFFFEGAASEIDHENPVLSKNEMARWRIQLSYLYW